MEYIALFVLFFIVLFIGFSIYYKIKLKKETYMTVSQVQYFSNKFKIDKNKIVYKSFFRMLSLINSLIISFVGSLIVWKTNYFIELGIGFVLLLMLIYALYEIYGRELSKKWGKI